MPERPRPLRDAAPPPGSDLLLGAPVGVGSVGADLRWRWLNPALAAAFGGSPGELSGRGIEEAIEAIRPNAAAALKVALESGEAVVGLEASEEPSAGAAARTWRLAFYPRPRADGDGDGENGGVDGFDVVALEVSERRRVEERFAAVSATAAALKGLLTPDDVGRVIVEEIVPALGADAGFVGVIDGEGTISIEAVGTAEPRSRHRVSRRRRRYRLRDLPLVASALDAGRPVVAAPDSRRGPQDELRGGVDEGSLPHPDAAPFGRELAAEIGFEASQITAVAIPLSRGDGRGVLGLVYAGRRDFGERDSLLFGAVGELCDQAFERARLYEADRLAREANELLRFVVDSADDAIISTDLEGRVTSWNAGAESIFGLTTGEMLGQQVDRLVPDDRRDEASRIRAAILQGDPIRLDLTQRLARDGRRVDLSITVSPVRDDHGRVIGDARIERDLTLLVRAQRSERAAAERLRSLIESSPNGVLLADEDGVIEFVNRTAAELFGYREDELTGESIDVLVPDTLRAIHRGHREAYLLDPATRPMGHGRNLLGLRKDGALFPVEIGLSSFVSDGRRFVAAVIADITARREAEAGRLESEARLAHALAAARMAAWEWDLDAGTVSWSANAESVVGPVPSTGDAFVAWTHTGPGRPEPAAVQRAITAGEGYAVEFAVAGEGGQTVWLQGEGRVSAGPGGHMIVSGVLMDVTGRRSAERDLRRVSDTLAALVAASPIAIVLFDLDGTVQLWNRTAERLFGWREDEVVGGPNPAVPTDRRADAAEFLSRVAAGETVVNHEETWATRAGKQLQVTVSAAPARGADGWTIGIVALIEDVTARRLLEEQLLQGQKMEGIGRLAGGVAHDFNNMLTAIQGFAELLGSELPAFGSERESLDGIREAANRAAALTRQLLAFSRRQHLEPKVLELNDVVVGLEPMLRRLIGEDVALVVSARPSAGRILADPSQLEQVLLNLVVNARDAMPHGGRLSIETDTVVFDEVYALEHYEVPPGRYVMLAVSDTGVGMDRETRLHVFEPFFTTKEQGKGTGLGLSTIYGIVRQSGGHIWLYSEPGEGTTFKVYFPLVTDLATLDDRHAARPAVERGSETVLLVEDEVAVRNLMSIVLKRHGYELLVAKSGEEAVEIAAAYAGGIDLLVTDVVMSGMTGPEVARTLRRQRPEIATLLLSGYTEEVFANARGLDDADGFLSKPFTPDVLARKIREVLRARQDRPAGKSAPVDGGSNEEAAGD